MQFYELFPEIFHSLSVQSTPLLTWTHYRILLRVPGRQVREWYAREAAEQMWSVRTLDRNVQTQYYHRMLHAQDKPALETSDIEKWLDISDIQPLSSTTCVVSARQWSGSDCRARSVRHSTPWATMALATLTKPAALAPSMRSPSWPYSLAAARELATMDSMMDLSLASTSSKVQDRR